MIKTCRECEGNCGQLRPSSTLQNIPMYTLNTWLDEPQSSSWYSGENKNSKTRKPRPFMLLLTEDWHEENEQWADWPKVLNKCSYYGRDLSFLSSHAWENTSPIAILNPEGYSRNTHEGPWRLMQWKWDGKVFCLLLYMGTSGGAVGWCTALQAGRSRIRSPMVWFEIFIDIIFLAILWSWDRLSL